MKSKYCSSTLEYIPNQLMHAVTLFGQHTFSLSSLKFLTCVTKCHPSTRHKGRMPSDYLL